MSYGKSGSDGVILNVYVVSFSLLEIFGLYRLSICPTWKARGSSMCGVGRTTLELSTGGAWYCLCGWFAGALGLLLPCRACFGREDCPSGPVGWAYGQASPARQPVVKSQQLVGSLGCLAEYGVFLRGPFQIHTLCCEETTHLLLRRLGLTIHISRGCRSIRHARYCPEESLSLAIKFLEMR